MENFSETTGLAVFNVQNAASANNLPQDFIDSKGWVEIDSIPKWDFTQNMAFFGYFLALEKGNHNDFGEYSYILAENAQDGNHYRIIATTVILNQINKAIELMGGETGFPFAIKFEGVVKSQKGKEYNNYKLYCKKND